MGQSGASGTTRTIALVGPPGSGKTSLLEAMMFSSGSISRQGEVAAGSSVGDSSPEARQRGQSVETNLAGFDYLGDHFAVIDCPGSTEFSGAEDIALPAVDLAIVVVDPQPDKAVLAQPVLRAIESLGVPHAVFVNKIDQARGPLDELIKALEAVSSLPVVARQLPLFEGEKVTGFVDLALERAFVYRAGQASARIDMPQEIGPAEADARFHMLEQLAEYDDTLLEQLVSDIQPDQDTVFADLVTEMQERKITPVFLGSATGDFGIRRLLKALRHEAPKPDAAAARLGLDGPAAYVFKVSHAGQMGKLAFARAFGGELADGADFTLPDGSHSRAGGLFAVAGGATKKVSSCAAGDVIAIAKIENAAPGMALSTDGKAREAKVPPRRAAQYALAIEAKDRKDDVRLSAALTKLLEEDTALAVRRDADTQQTLLEGQGEGHLTLTIDRLRRRFGLEVNASRPATAYRESIRKGVTQRGRHKKQTGGHGQFGDVLVEIRPAARGTGFAFAQKITGGVVPKQWIPAVEQGLRDGTIKGPLGFPVIDLEAVLIDGSYHSVDSSEMAFRAAGRLAMVEGLRACDPYLLEPIQRLTITAPTASTPKITAAVSSLRGQILAFAPKDGWPGWDEIEAYMPEVHTRDFITELRGITHGLGVFEAVFDHMAELTGRLADDVIKRQSHAA
ncbi:elongation factor G [Phenylobacterium montanum]|uniref:Elongation factor G n=1 Tax=Phenylobacterium montanum TaxID=2823693 RepID=A0A975G274_9CAUL|nr:elongation factor G [Caulobacter sp. S6]QUD89419.1 elongation factor G [Caulobacter sp. S6]